MVTPHDEAEEPDGHHGPNHRLVAEDGLAGEDGQNFRDQTHGGEDHDVDLGVTEEPEEMLPEERLSSLSGEEGRAEIQVGEKHGRRGRKHRNGENEQPSCNEERPDRERQTEHGHARGTHVGDRRDVVGRAGDGRETVHEQADAPETLPHLRVVHVGRGGAERRVGRPSGLRSAATDEEAGQNDDARQHVEPVTHGVQRGEGHVPRPDFQRDEVIAESADEERHDDKEHHDRGVHGEEHVVAAGKDDAVNRDGGRQQRSDQRDRHAGVSQLVADAHGEQTADEEKEETGPEILQTDHLVIERPDVFGKETLLVPVVSVVDGWLTGIGDKGRGARAHSLLSSLRGASPAGWVEAVDVRRVRAAAAALASSALALILPACHFSNSSCVTTRIGAFML